MSSPFSELAYRMEGGGKRDKQEVHRKGNKVLMRTRALFSLANERFSNLFLDSLGSD